MSKNDIVEKLVKSSEGFSSKNSASKFYDVIVSAFIEKLCETESLRISGLGNFTIVNCAERKYRSPSTGEIIVVPTHKKVRFKQSKNVAERVNK